VTPWGAPYHVQPYIPGRDGREWLASHGGRISLADALWIVSQVLEVLVCAHANGVIHRDLKPENVIIRPDGVWVIDFGIARVASARRVTIQGAPMGTPGYMSPEACAGRWDELDPSADTFAVGAILFELLTGRLPWQGPTPLFILAATLTHPAPPVRSLRPDVPAEVAAIVDRALSQARDARYPTAVDMLADLRAADANTSS
jgi:serine/threonine-protein kinase